MNKQIMNIAVVVLCVGLMAGTCSSSAEQSNNQVKDMTDQKDSLSYALGVLMGSSLKGQDMDLDQATFSAAFSAAVKGEELLMDEETANGFFQEYQQELAGKASAENKKKGEEFLAENSKRSEVTTTASGLQYEVLQDGTGETPIATDQVTVHYTGKLLNGEVFDSSVERGEPATFGLNQVIRGWTEGVQLMKEGAKYRFFIPAELAYGDRGAGPTIGPGSTLIFDVELIKVEK
jgi:FKBP-type peptidyl-prolyl cis-trans isomerase